MAKKRSDKTPYKSKYGGGFISSAQYISELVCENRAHRNGQQLVARFWNTKKWKNIFRYQLILAHGLLKIYAHNKLTSVIRETPSIISLRTPILDDLIQKHKIISNNPSPIKNIDTKQKPKKPFISKKKKNLWSILDGEKK